MDIIAPQTEEDFRLYFDLRWRILRAPWQQPPGSERDELETQSWHRMACLHVRTPVGVARLHLNSAQQAQIRYMAVEEAARGQGIGHALTQALEEQAFKLNAQEIILHARDSCVGFYERMGYQVVAPSHTLYDSIHHHLMRKTLS